MEKQPQQLNPTVLEVLANFCVDLERYKNRGKDLYQVTAWDLRYTEEQEDE